MQNTKSKRVFIYTEVVPALSMSGANVRVYTNIRAYCELNYDVSVFIFSNHRELEIPMDLKDICISFTIINPDSELPKKIKRHSRGYINEKLLNRYFPSRRIIKYYLMKNLEEDPNSIHHFEYLSTVNAIVGLKGFFIWSNHDIVSERHLLVQKFRREIGHGKNYINNIFKYFILRYIETLVVNSCRLMFTVSKHDQKYYHDRFKSNKINLLPWCTSIDNNYVEKSRKIKDGRINLLHLGSTNSILTYSSLKYILKVLFKKLPSKILNNIQLTVVGNNPDAPYSNIIKKYAIPYKQVTFEGFKKNIEPLFETHDLQIVATQYASGIRTKIIESLAHGLPVMSSDIGARGLYGLKNKENILLFKNERDFTEIFNGIMNNSINLNSISTKARCLYEEEYSKKIHHFRLKDLLNQNHK